MKVSGDSGAKGFLGLLVKDFKLIVQNKTLLAVLLIIEVVFFVMQGMDGAAFVMSYMIMGCSVLVLSTINMDEYDKSMVFLMTMPVSRKDYVFEKYVLSFFATLSGCIVALIPCFLLNPAGIGELLVQAAGILIVMALIQMVALPIRLKFGGESGRIVFVSIFAVFVLLMVFVEKVENRYAGQVKIQDWAEQVSVFFHKMSAAEMGCTAVIICVICFAVSFRVSKGIMERKEF